MTEALHDTFVIERTYPQPPARVFAAFADPAKKRRWYGEADNHSVEAFEMDFRVGGVERATYRLGPNTPFPGTQMINDGAYYDIVPDARIVVGTAMMFGGRRITVSLITFEFLATEGGTRLICTHQGVFFEGSGGPEMRERGWRVLFDRLAAEVGAESASA
ncbi:MAG TPA: SRPBCC family protein [Phenylobacterium sp.]|jgi:uncharacterized protein YndB with AHSA1/START domain|uniref:SRPBCC family protein n=1 Tax=Phenylobacterium sp. TaxID=1871053 RepID=UPI002D608CA1|nr:SRPBCC family protein [Phenylobacterium sp.]HZZ67866.1 SRPBCC family protein [Phenylobacterium sp.]